MRLGILKADSVLPHLEVDFGGYPEMFRSVLGTADGTLEFETWDIEHCHYPASLDACDGYVITGSRKSVYDDEPWIHRLADFVRELDRTRTPMVGICFGHQMIAHALGGHTQSAPQGWNVGVHHYELIGNPAFAGDDGSSFNLLASHKDQVMALPPGATLVATSEHCPNAAMQVGEHILSFQGHPEFCKPYSRALMQMREAILGEEKFSAGMQSLSAATDEPTVARWMLRFLRAAKP